VTTIDNADQLYVIGTDPVKDSLLIIKNLRPSQLTPQDTLSAYFYPNYNRMRADNAGGNGSGEVVPMNWNQKLYLQGKLGIRIAPEMKMTVTGIMEKTESYPYDKAYILNPDGKGLDHNKSYTGILSLTHTISNSTFYTVGASLFTKEFRHYLYESASDPLYVHPDLTQTKTSYSFLTGGNDLNRFYRMTTTALLKIDVNSQVNNEHFVKVGAEVRKHRRYQS
jgi:hypothetical protein